MVGWRNETEEWNWNDRRWQMKRGLEPRLWRYTLVMTGSKSLEQGSGAESQEC